MPGMSYEIQNAWKNGAQGIGDRFWDHTDTERKRSRSA